MNKQFKVIDGVKVNTKIEWTDWTYNPITGCFHACQWRMTDAIANCYAEDVALGVAGMMYPQGFEHHYWHPERLDEPLRVKTPSKIFVCSMSDLFGYWVDSDQIKAVLDMCNRAPQHTFQLLTKNPVRAKEFDLPENVWVGASMPPDFMWGKELSERQKHRLLATTLKTLGELKSAKKAKITWMSAEPLSWNISPLLKAYEGAIDWCVIGAASNGNKYYPPREADFRSTLEELDRQGVVLFYKGNMKSLPFARDHWRADFPLTPYEAPTPATSETSYTEEKQLRMF